MKRMTLKMMAEDFGKTALNLGRADENKAVRIEIDLSNLLEITPDANASVTVETPSGKKYPATTSKEGKLLIWDVNSADTAEEGRGWAQLTITGSNDEVLKSVVTATRVWRSIRGEGTAPDPVQNWVDDATSKLGNVVSAGENAKEAAEKAEEAAKRANDAAEKAENGCGVQSDYAQNDEAQPDYIKHRPGGYDVVTPGVTIQWDGVIGDRTVLTIVNDDIFRDVKISDVVLTKEMLIGAIADGVEVQEGHLTDGDGYVSLAMGSKQILSFSKTGSVDVNGFEHRVTETGTYAYVPSMDPVPSNLYIAELVTANVVKPVQIPAKYLDLATPDYRQNDATQPDYIKNRPGGYYQTVPGVDITWDGVIGDRPKAQPEEGMYLVKVSDEILTADRVIGATVVMVRGAESQSMILSEDQIMSGDGFVMEARVAIISCSKTTVEIYDGMPLTLPETGTYFLYMEQDGNKMYVSSLTKPETQELVPIPGELTNIKGGYDLPDKTEELYNGTITADSWVKHGESSQLRSVSARAVVEPFAEAPIALAVELIEGATITGTVAGVKVSGTVHEGSASLFSKVTRASAGERLVCKITQNSIKASSAPETDIDVQLIQRVEGGPALIPAEYLDTTALETDIGNAQTTANSAQTTANEAQIAANNAQTTANNAQTAATSDIRTNNLFFRSYGNTDNQTTDIPLNLGVKIGNMYKSSTGRQYYPVSLTANDGLQFSADTSNPTETHVHLYTEKSNNVISGILELHDNYGNFIRIRPDSITAYRLTFENGIIIRSSTAGSTKKFKITVDDAGTLSATEVTT